MGTWTWSTGVGARCTGVEAFCALVVAIIVVADTVGAEARFRRNDKIELGESCKLMKEESITCLKNADEGFKKSMEKYERDTDSDVCTNKVCEYMNAVEACYSHEPCEDESKNKKEKFEEIIDNQDCNLLKIEQCSIMKQLEVSYPGIFDLDDDYDNLMDKQEQEYVETNSESPNEEDYIYEVLGEENEAIKVGAAPYEDETKAKSSNQEESREGGDENINEIYLKSEGGTEKKGNDNKNDTVNNGEDDENNGVNGNDVDGENDKDGGDDKTDEITEEESEEDKNNNVGEVNNLKDIKKNDKNKDKHNDDNNGGKDTIILSTTLLFITVVFSFYLP